MKQLLIMLLLTPLLSQAVSTTGGNGGAGICLNKKCISLAKAGFKIAPEFKDRTFDISSDLVEEVKRIINQLPLMDKDKNRLIDEILGYRGTFIPLEIINEKKYQKTLSAYKKILGKSYVESKNFSLLAISDRSLTKREEKKFKRKKINFEPKTYLLEGFNNSDLESQALTLIHEASVRGKDPSILKRALEFDTLIYQKITNSLDFDRVNFYLVLNDLYNINTEYYIATEVLRLKGGYMVLSPHKLLSNFKSYTTSDSNSDLIKGYDSKNYSLKRSEMIEIRKLHPLFSNLIQSFRILHLRGHNKTIRRLSPRLFELYANYGNVQDRLDIIATFCTDKKSSSEQLYLTTFYSREVDYSFFHVFSCEKARDPLSFFVTIDMNLDHIIK